jgi:aminoglycoside 3-N-acetyltransferase
MYSMKELSNDFRKLDISTSDTVVLHASVRAVGEVAGDPDAIHLALKSALNPKGTLMVGY